MVDIGTRFHALNHLMPHRIREVLLVSSLYDAFILEEDGYLAERIFTEFKDLNLTSSPRVTHVSTGEAAIQAMGSRRYDLVITMTRLADMDVISFGRKVKALRPGRPVVLLALDEGELQGMPANLDREAIDGVFLWTGDANILLAIIKFIEDRENIANDIEVAGVRVIIVVEDTVRHYSQFLGLLYTAILAQAQSLLGEGLNDAQRIHRLRARSKVLLATNYEDAVALFERYKENVVAVISDIRYPRGGELDPDAGVKLARHIRVSVPDLPILLQSADPLKETLAAEIRARFVHKNSASLLHDVRAFLIDNLGFGDFVFRLPNGYEVGRVRDIREMRLMVRHVNAESLRYHADFNHISTWLMARCEFELASKLRPITAHDYNDDIEALRSHLISLLEEGHRQIHLGVISEFAHETFGEHVPFTRLGSGSIGGKARGIAFVNAMLYRGQLQERFPELPIHVPQTLVICTGIFDRFLEENHLREFAYGCKDDELLARRFLESTLPGGIRNDLRTMLHRIHGPLAIRSSGLLEDSAFEPFAGVYSTFMLANNHPDAETRLGALSTAIKMVYASTFFERARAYIDRTPHRIEEEKMAVIVQQVVGQQYGERFYPHFAGVAQTINHYPVGRQRAEDGVVLVGLGLGRIVVQGGGTLRFSPADPDNLPQLSSPRAALRNTQRDFWAIDMAQSHADLLQGEEVTLGRYTLQDAEDDGTLEAVASVFCAEDDRIREGLHNRGPRLVTFANVLRAEEVPLAKALKMLLDVHTTAMGCPVQIEFAVDMGDWGRWDLPEARRRRPALHVLQLRPMSTRRKPASFVSERLSRDPSSPLLCQTRQCLGTGLYEGIQDIIYVKHEGFSAANTPKMAQEVGEINGQLVAERRPYLLIGPGRWGSSDPWLGIPVQWSQINGAQVIIEASPPGYHVEPSEGTHFFQNITSLQIGYLTVPPGDDEASMDWAWLDALKPAHETGFLRHVKLDKPLVVKIDGAGSRAVIER